MDLGHDRFTAGLISVEVGSEHDDSIKSILGFLKLLDEELVGFTSLDRKGLKLDTNIENSVNDPVNMVVGVLDFVFNIFPMGSTGFSGGSVGVGNSSQFSNDLLSMGLLGVPKRIVLGLFIIDGLFELKEEVLNCVNSIGGHGVGSHHGADLLVEGGSVSGDAEESDNKEGSCFHWNDLCLCFVNLINSQSA